MNVDVVGGINDDKIIAALRAGNAPDVVSSFQSNNVGVYCPSGGWIDLGPYLKRDKIDVNQFPAGPRYYTQYKGIRCALPLLADTYGLYYNKTLFKQAGIKAPPKTFSELVADAKKLTKKNSDGTFKVLGYDPNALFYHGGAGIGDLRPADRRDVLRQGRQVEPRPRSRLDDTADLAEEPDRLLRLQEPRQVADGRRRRVRGIAPVRERASSR